MDVQPIKVFVDGEFELQDNYFDKIMFKFNLMINRYHQVVNHLTCHIFDPNYHQITDWISRHHKSSAIVVDYKDGYRIADTIILILNDIRDCYNKVEYFVKHNKRVFIYCKRTDTLREVEECTSD